MIRLELVLGLFVLGILALALWISPGFRKFIGSRGQSILALANIVLVLVALLSLYYAMQANGRAEKIFVGQDRPLLDVTPTSIAQNDAGGAGTVLSIANYSAFTAQKIGVDLKYGEYGWIGEWFP